MDSRPAGNRHPTNQQRPVALLAIAPLRCAKHMSTFLLIAITARFLNPFAFDYDDIKNR